MKSTERRVKMCVVWRTKTWNGGYLPLFRSALSLVDAAAEHELRRKVDSADYRREEKKYVPPLFGSWNAGDSQCCFFELLELKPGEKRNPKEKRPLLRPIICICNDL